MYKVTVAFVGNALIASCATNQAASASAQAQKIAENMGIGLAAGVVNAVDPSGLCRMSWNQFASTDEAAALGKGAKDFGHDITENAKQSLIAAFKAQLPSLKQMIPRSKRVGNAYESLEEDPNCDRFLENLLQLDEEKESYSSDKEHQSYASAEEPPIDQTDENDFDVDDPDLLSLKKILSSEDPIDQTSYDSDNLDSLSYKGMVSSEEPIKPAFAQVKQYLKINPERYEAV